MILVTVWCQLSCKQAKINMNDVKLIAGKWAGSGEYKEKKLSIHSQENLRNENSRLITPDTVA